MSEIEHACSMPCHKCIKTYDIKYSLDPRFMLNSLRMILCEFCGNKRCPHASDHRLECTNSNEVGQKGSVYE